MEDSILEKIIEAGFKNVDEFVKKNLQYLPKEKKKLFYLIENLRTEYDFNDVQSS